MMILLANISGTLILWMFFSSALKTYVMYSKSFLNLSEDSANSQKSMSFHAMEKLVQLQGDFFSAINLYCFIFLR